MRQLKLGERSFQAVNVLLLLLFSVIMLLPLLTVAATSISTGLAVDRGEVQFWPVDITFASWEQIISQKSLWLSMLVNTAATVLGTLICMVVSSLTAYPLSKKEFKAGKFIILLVVFAMIFKAPIIPYFLTLKSYGLYNTFWALVIPHTIVAYNLIILLTFFKQVPHELEEAAKIEGCGYFQTLFRIILPVSMPALVTVGLFYAVMIWNQFMHPIMFIDNPNLYPLQMKLRELITVTDLTNLASTFEDHSVVNERTLRSATVLFAAIPILLVYPFLQKHFVKGAMLGSLKE